MADSSSLASLVMVSEVDSLIGRVIGGKFIVESFLGGGAMGTVYRAHQTSLDKPVAIKVMRAILKGDKLFAARFHREAKAASKLDHPSSIRILDYGEEPDGLLYIVMEYLEGRNLFRLLHEEWPLAHDRIVNIVSQVLAALAVAHDAGVLHRDLKPENVMVASRVDDEGNVVDHVKVCDFGIAKIVNEDPRSRQDPPSELHTTEGLIVGTPEYMSPEQGRGEPLDARSDLYSVGVLLYQMLCNQVPFDADTPLGVVMRHLTTEPVPPSRVYPHASAHLEAVCLRAMRKERDERFPSARDMRTELRSPFGPSVPLVMPGAPHAAAHPPLRDSRAPTRQLPAAVPPPPVLVPSDAPGSLALVSRSILPAPRPRSPFWPVASVIVLVASVAAAAIIATGASIPLVRGDAASPAARPARDIDRSDSLELRRGYSKRTPRSAIVSPPEPVGPSSAAPAPREPSRRGRHGARPAPSAPLAPGAAPSAAPASPPLAPLPAQLDADHAEVTVGAISRLGLDESSVRKLIDGGGASMNRCYRDAVRAGTRAQGAATLALETDVTGKIAKVSLRGISLPPAAVECIVNVFRNAHVDDDATGFGLAEATLTFTLP